MLHNVSVYNKESSYIYGSNYFLTITKICYAQTHMRGKASHPSFLFYINILSPLPYQAFVILQASLPLPLDAAWRGGASTTRCSGGSGGGRPTPRTETAATTAATIGRAERER